MKAIQDSGGVILGMHDLDAPGNGLDTSHEVIHRSGGTVWLYEGATRLRPASVEEAQLLPVRSTWGTRVFGIKAEFLLVRSRTEHVDREEKLM